jgi:hypothetical protein
LEKRRRDKQGRRRVGGMVTSVITARITMKLLCSSSLVLNGGADRGDREEIGDIKQERGGL